MNDAFRFPALHHLCGAYLNRDWPRDYRTIQNAVRAYARETDAARRSAVIGEIDDLLESSPAAVRDALTALGCAYAFADSEAAVAFLWAARLTLVSSGS